MKAYVRIYDNDGKTMDRFTAVFLNDYNPRNGLYACLGMSERPFHPQGFGQHGECQDGLHLGHKIAFEELPLDCQDAVNQEIEAYNNQHKEERR